MIGYTSIIAILLLAACTPQTIQQINPPIRDLEPGPYVVFFEHGSDEITNISEVTLRNLVRIREGWTEFPLGYVLCATIQTTETEPAELTEARLQAVEQRFSNNGVPASAIERRDSEEWWCRDTLTLELTRSAVWIRLRRAPED